MLLPSRFRALAEPVTLKQVQKALPAGAALVEFFNYRPYDPKARTPAEEFGPARYVAYVLDAAGEPLWADLGGAKEMEAEASRLLTRLSARSRPGASESAPLWRR